MSVPSFTARIFGERRVVWSRTNVPKRPTCGPPHGVQEAFLPRTLFERYVFGSGLEDSRSGEVDFDQELDDIGVMVIDSPRLGMPEEVSERLFVSQKSLVSDCAGSACLTSSFTLNVIWDCFQKPAFSGC